MYNKYKAQTMSSTYGYPPGKLSETVKDLPQWIQDGLGDQEYYCEEKKATFRTTNPPEEMPDLSKHGNIMATVLKNNPDLYKKLLKKKTKNGVSLAQCIKTGIDNPGHPHIKTCGIVAGDEESYEVFKDLFDPIIQIRHDNYTRHLQNAQQSQGQQPAVTLRTTKLDPEGKYILTCRVRSGRSVRGFQLPPCITFNKRRELEEVIVKALMSITDEELKGTYFGLHGSQSTAAWKTQCDEKTKARIVVMDNKKEEELRKEGKLFQEPDSTLLLSSGCGRHWPDARGIFHNDAQNALIWVNEEDHMRIISMEKSRDMQGVFRRFVNLTDVLERQLKKMGKEIMYNDRLQYILTCPSNTGTGLRAGCMMKLPNLSKQANFKDMLKDMGLQARGGGGVDSGIDGGVVDVSNAGRIGKSETEFVNILIDGVEKLIKLEKELEQQKS